MEKFLKLLEYAVMNSPAALTLKQFSEALGFSKTTTARILRTLAANGYLEHAGPRKGYRAGLRAHSFSNNIRYDSSFEFLARPICRNCAEELHSSVMISVMRKGQRLILIHENYSSLRNIHIIGIAIDDLYNTASGLVLLSQADPKERVEAEGHFSYPDVRDMILKKCFPGKSFDEVLEQVRRDGFSSFVTPIWAVTAVPVLSGGKCIAALSSSLPAGEATAESQKKALETIMKMARYLSEKLAFRIPG